MKILIDEGMSTYRYPTGIGLHAINLYNHLKNITNCSITDYTYFKYFPKGFRKLSIDAYINLVHPYRNYNIIHYQNNFVPFTEGKSKKVVTIHDLGVFLYPKTVPFVYIEYNRHSVKNALKRADGIITPSQSVKNEILNMFGKKYEDKIFVSYDGIRDIFFTAIPKIEQLNKYKLKPYSYYFFLGSLSKRKNTGFLLKSFIKAKKEKILAKDTLLVLGGYKWWGSSEFEELINEDNGILSLGYIDDEDIPALYGYSRAFIFPSIYEGFGMPIIEAMSQKVPIIISNIPTSIELNIRHNNQMKVFDLNNEDSFLSTLREVEINNEDIRKNLNYGDLSLYNYENIAKEHLNIYKILS
ncbi:glycosyltransferase family 4 protein [Melioribacter sp. Ez-97]|uniref:glycosyltransferase family 4 protein n=1 Tax=Melioribacter sp. Ez-97 TaxID=3423434 RepID=UPI003ED92785